MPELTENDRLLLEAFHKEYKSDEQLQNAILDYTEKHGLVLPDDVLYVPGIDFIEVRIGEIPILTVGLPPVSNYPVRETEHTDKYLRPGKSVAV